MTSVLARGQQERGGHLHAAGERRLVGLHSQPQHVLDSGFVDLDVERHVPALDVAVADDRARGDDVRLTEPGVHAVEPRIAVGAVDDGLEAREQRDRLIRDVEREVRRFRLAVHLDALERAAILTDRRQDAVDALDVVEVGLPEGVLAADRGQRRILRLPRTERPCRFDAPARDGVGDSAREARALGQAEPVHHHIVNLEDAGELVGFPCGKLETGVTRDDLVDHD